MATVGLNFGSATSGAGFDVSSTVTQILAMESAVEVPWKAQLAGLQAKDVALSGIGTALSTLSTAVSALTNFDGVLASKQGSSSDTNVLTLSSAGSTAVAGSHTVIVTSLAQTSSQFSDRIATASDTLSGSITLQIGSVSNTITLDSTSNTLSTLAQAINSGSYGVKASVVTDTLGSRLSLVSTARSP
jgi:flagellar hook-associated protein 2